MTWKEMLDSEDCELCPYMIEAICTGGMNCFGGEPVYPPCTEYDIPADKDMNELRNELSRSIQLQEEREQKRIKQEKMRRERARKAAATRQEIKWFCHAELEAVQRLKKKISALESISSFAKSLSFAVNATNEMFQKAGHTSPEYETRISPKPEINQEIEQAKRELILAEQTYEQKRKQFFEKRKKPERSWEK